MNIITGGRTVPFWEFRPRFEKGRQSAPETPGAIFTGTARHGAGKDLADACPRQKV